VSLVRTRRLVLAVATLSVIEGCGSSATPSPPPPTAPPRVYASIQNPSGTVSIFSMPLTSASTAVSSFAGTSPTGMCVDAAHRLYIAGQASGGSVSVFSQPIANGATPAFTLTSFGTNTVDCAIDAAGNLYVADILGAVRVFKAPITASSTLDHSITASVTSPYGVAVDAAGDVFVSDSTTITEYSPFASGNTLLHTFGSIFNNWGLAIGPDGDLYVANGTANGEIDVYKPPFLNTSTPDHSLSIPGSPRVLYFAFDAATNMYVSGNTTSSWLWELVPPYTAAPMAAVTVNGATNASGGVAVDQ